MKIKEGFILREVAGNTVVVAVGSAGEDFNGMVKLNELGAFLWKQLQNDISFDNLLANVLDAYEVEPERAERDITSFIEKLKEDNFLECE